MKFRRLLEGVAQLAERQPSKLNVAGSTPVTLSDLSRVLVDQTGTLFLILRYQSHRCKVMIHGEVDRRNVDDRIRYHSQPSYLSLICQDLTPMALQQLERQNIIQLDSLV